MSVNEERESSVFLLKRKTKREPSFPLHLQLLMFPLQECSKTKNLLSAIVKVRLRVSERTAQKAREGGGQDVYGRQRK